jgi:predicted short-subunit dehydrogenase-like oxidoreductase (DUF2520 family)
MRITLVGPGRAGRAVAAAARDAGHEIVDVLARRLDAAREAADLLGAPHASLIRDGLRRSDLVIIATRDDVLAEVAGFLAPTVSAVGAAVHLSGLTSVLALNTISAARVPTGSFHPLQTFPTTETGAVGLRDAWIGITTSDESLRVILHDFGSSMGGIPFDLNDEVKALYHAAASAASNFPLASLVMASDLFEEAGVPFAAARPLLEAIVRNAFDLGPRAALTGPVARGDRATVEAQVAAVAAAAPDHDAGFRALVGQLALLTGRADQFAALVDQREREFG